jgi:hypothetical protein
MVADFRVAGCTDLHCKTNRLMVPDKKNSFNWCSIQKILLKDKSFKAGKNQEAGNGNPLPVEKRVHKKSCHITGCLY